MSLPKFGLSYGEHAATDYPRGTTYAKGKSELRHYVSSVDRNQKRQPMCSGLAHVLWSCPFARNVWALIRGRVQKCSNEVDDFFLLFKKMQTVLEEADLDRWAVTAWSIWNARNKFYFDHVQLQPRIIMERATSVLVEYQTCMATSVSLKKKNTKHVWQHNK